MNLADCEFSRKSAGWLSRSNDSNLACGSAKQVAAVDPKQLYPAHSPDL